MSKYRCSCGFDEGTEKATEEHMKDIYWSEVVRRKRLGLPKLEQEHIASWRN